MIPKTFPMRFTPKGLSDAFDSTDKFPGACRQLTNLVFDQSNPELMVSKPGATNISSFSGFNTPGVVSLQATIGTRVYGMVATARNPGKDEPFCYDLAAAAFVSISGVTNGNSPTSQATTGPWTPPTIAQIGTMIVITHPGYPGTGAHFFGVIDVTNPAAPAYDAVNLVANPLTAVPSAVANLNNRAYFAVGNTLPYSDVLTNPLTRTNATQQLTVGDSGNITALAGLPIQTTSSGVLQSLTLFKASQIWQVTGDTTSSNLALNYVSLTLGTVSPRSVAQAPQGLYFSDVAGPYILNLYGIPAPVTFSQDNSDPDIQQPWLNATEPSRIAACYSGSIYRICIPSVVFGQSGSFDYWFDEHRRRWHGPHTFSYDCASAFGNYFVLTSNANPAQLIKSQSESDTTSVYTDLGTPMIATMFPATLPKVGHMTQKQVVESTQELSASGGNASYSITAQDEQGNALGSVAISVVSAGKVWGGGNLWGDGTKWTNSLNIPRVYNLNWPAPLVFKKISPVITATASANLQIGTHYSRYQDTGYVNALNP